MRILCVGDIVGKTGRAYIKENIEKIKKDYEIDFIVANGENAAGGVGLTRPIYDELISYGINAITLGNHTWSKKEIIDFIDEVPYLVRPANYTSDCPGKEYIILNTPKANIAIINANGRTFMDNIDCPFKKVNSIIDEIYKWVDIIIVDFHAEATSEKLAFGNYLDGRATIVFGTHTHVPTADARILPRGSAYITDVGMVGAKDSIIGVEKEAVINKFLTAMPARFEVSPNEAEFSAILVDIDEHYEVKSIKRISDKDIN